MRNVPNDKKITSQTSFILKLILILLLFFTTPGNSLEKSLFKRDVGAEQVTCKAMDFMRLQNKALQDDFFIQLDSIRHVQYPNNDQAIGITVDLTPALLIQFLKDIDQDSLIKNERFEKEYHFNIAPEGYSDPPKCKDKISIEYYPESCKYRMVILNTFLSESNWCTGHQVVYSFGIKGDRVVDFGRNEAG